MRKSKSLLYLILSSVIFILFASKFAIAATYIYTSRSSQGATYGGGTSAVLDSSYWNCYSGGEGIWYVRTHVDNGDEPGGTYDCPQDIDATSGSGTCDAGAGYYYLYDMVVRVYFDESDKECMCMNTGHDNGAIDTCGSDDYSTGSGGNACWTGSFCCGDDTEYWMQADVGGTDVCCDSTSDCVISSACINSGSNSGGYCCYGTSSAASCASGSASCADDGLASSSTCYWDESCTSSAYTAPTTASCLNANCNADGLASSSTCYWDETCTGTGRTVSSIACLNANCNTDGLASSSTCYWDETCTGTGRTVSSIACLNANCNADGLASSSTCYWDETCTGTGRTVSSIACLNANCNADGVDSGGTCYYDESCTGTGRTVSSSSCASGSSSCSDDGYAASSTCYYNEACTGSGYTAPTTAACLNANCNTDGLDSSGTCYWDEACTGTGRTVSSSSCASGSSSCSDDGYASGDSCYYDETCTGSGYTAPTVDVSQQVCSHHVGTCPGSDCVYYTQCNERNCGGTGWQCYSTTSDTPCASSCYDCNNDNTCDPTNVADKGSCYCTANCAGGLTCNAQGYCVDGTEGGASGDCYDGIDNDMDSLIDCADPNCAGQLGPSTETCCQPATKLTDCSSYTTGNCGEISCTSNECGVAQNTALCTTTGECGTTTGTCNAEPDGSYTCLWTGSSNLCTNDEMCGGAPAYLCQNICSQGGCLFCYSECQVSVDDGNPNTLPNEIGQCVAHGWWTSC